MTNEIKSSPTREMIQQELAKRDSYPQKDYSNKKERASSLEAITGHPLSSLRKENEKLQKYIISSEFRYSLAMKAIFFFF